jgi:hypothetical protein
VFGGLAEVTLAQPRDCQLKHGAADVGSWPIAEIRPVFNKQFDLLRMPRAER